MKRKLTPAQETARDERRAPQFDLPGQAEVFNLSGETIRQAAPTLKAAPDATPNLFGPCLVWRPYHRADGTEMRRCRDCGQLESEHEAKPEPPKKCGKQLFGFMPPCALDAGHAGDCEDGFGGHYHHEDSKPETRKEKAE